MTTTTSPAPSPVGGLGADTRGRRIRICYFNTWARRLEEARAYADRAATIEVAPLVSNPSDGALLRKARLDCDWYGENARCFAAMRHGALEFLPAWVSGPAGLLELGQRPREPGEERWLITMGQQPQALKQAAGRVFAVLAQAGVKHLLYAFDDASHAMPCFNDIAPYLDVLIHDESPLAPVGRGRLREDCRTQHRSWVANLVPFAAPFNETPEEKIIFLGSQLGLTPHRQRQLDTLRAHFKDRFVASHDHSVSVANRYSLNRFKVSVCPEGRHFTSPAMSRSHTDRPFWSGCLGMVPVSENSKTGGRLDELSAAGLILRYGHGDRKALIAACEQALALPVAQRRRIHDYFNRHETVGSVAAEMIAGGVADAPGGETSLASPVACAAGH